MGSVATFPGPREAKADGRGVTALLTIIDAAEVLGVSKHYVQDRIKDGELRIVELGSNIRAKLRVRADDLQAFIDGRTSAGAA
ncbi:helix-turn-helix domain-containing protein [Arthrobacter silvisoli]|uniref:helix-turn-helix domain-containing protein n=1 Tax=Arthrobacter silvisoli TaxID=2291022 RepID=UPI0014443AED|nr:helix-turn-helix domain-containing protein [Arthrobacter silvisoli]